MSEDPATYYTPQARFIQSTDRVWIVMPPEPSLAAMGDTIGQVAAIIATHGTEHVGMYNNVPPMDLDGREMVLVPKDTLQAIMAAIRSAHMHLPETDANVPLIANIEWSLAHLETLLKAPQA